jgi:arginine deiminase
MAAMVPHYTLDQTQDAPEARHAMAINVVPLAPEVVVMPAGDWVTSAALEVHGVTCQVEVDELMKGTGLVHCMTGVIHRLKEVA